jgi:hypothetical protein
MACNDICGRELLRACAAAGLRVPDDVAVVGVDNDELMCALSNPPASSGMGRLPKPQQKLAEEGNERRKNKR